MIHIPSGIEIYGTSVQGDTRCVHYHSDLDVIAIRFKCCDRYYPCYSCHEEVAGHRAVRWSSADHDVKAILCGCCGNELTIREYLGCNATCPACGGGFNQNCSLHYNLYFEASQ